MLYNRVFVANFTGLESCRQTVQERNGNALDDKVQQSAWKNALEIKKN